MFSFFENYTNPFPPNDHLSPPRKLWAFCRYFSRGFYLPIVVMGVTSLFIAAMEASLFAFLGQIVDWLNAANRATFLQDEGGNLLLIGFMMVIGIPVVNVIWALSHNQSLMGNFPMAARWRMHNYLLGQSMQFYQDEFAGRISTKVMQTALSLRQLVVKTVDIFVYIIVYVVSMLAIFANLNLWLLVPVLIWLVGYAFLQKHFIPKMRDISQRQAHARSTMTGRVTDAYTNINTIKLFSHTQRETDYARESMEDFLGTVYTQFRLVSKLDIILNTINYLMIFSVTAIGIALWLEGDLSSGAIAAAVAMALRMTTMSKWIIWEISSLFEQVGTVLDGMSMMTLPRLVQDQPNAQPLVLKKGEIEFEDIYFHYQGKKEDKHLTVIENLNLRIKAGEKIGLVGRSGAGKSTLVNTLLRFYDLQGGRILIDGQDIKMVTQESLRENIAMVTQDTSLLHRSVRENILYGRPDASDDELQQAIEKAKADFITQLSDQQGNTGLDAQVGERGVKLSGGQRQRIALARVFLKDAPILILDEATSALDSEVEAAIQDSLMRLMEGKTVIAIAHRLSTIAEMDRLVVLEDGKIVEEGSHAELLAKGGIYARLWTRQTGGYLGDNE